MKTSLENYRNDWYVKTIGAGPVKRMAWYIVNVLFFLNPLNPSSRLKVFFLRCFGASVGKGVVIKPGVNIKYPWKLIIDDYSWVGENVWIDNLAQVSIGANVCISQGAMLLTGNHNYKKSSFDLMVEPIVLEDGVWVGAKVVVCPGVRASSHAVITVQSVATKTLEAYTVYQGNPAIAVKKRDITD